MSNPHRDAADRALAWVLAGGLALVVIPWAVVVLVMMAGSARSGRRQSGTDSTNLDVNDAKAALAVDALARCLVDDRAARPGRGFPSSLEDRGSTRHRCAPADLVSGRTGTHRLSYLPALPGREGLVTAFTLCAEPLAFGTTGRQTIVAEAPARDALSIAGFRRRVGYPQSQRGPRPLGCSDAWSMDSRLQTAIRHCAFLYATSHPELGYPSRIGELVAPESGCLSVVYGTLSVSRDVVTWESAGGNVTRLAYLPETPDRSGRTTAFEIHVIRAFDEWSDESAVEHSDFSREQRLWKAATMQDRVRLRVGVDFVPNLPRLEKECSAGRASSCADLGDTLFLDVRGHYNPGAPWDKVARAYRQACEGGVSLGCLRVFELVEDLHQLLEIGVGHATLDVESIACSFLDRGCAIEPGEACWKGVLALESATCPAGSGPSLDERIERACRTRRPGACGALGERYLASGGRPWGFGQVAPLLDAACHSTDPAACAVLGRMLLARPSEPQAGPRARQLFRRACALAAEAAACQAMADGVPPG